MEAISHISITSFNDELEKIAMSEDNKEMLKRFGLSTAAVAGGTATGIGLGELAIKAIEKLGPEKATNLRRLAIKYGVPSAMAAGALALTQLARKRADEYRFQGNK